MVAILLLSHSKKLVDGLAEIIQELTASQVLILATGGEQSLGVSPTMVLDAMNSLISLGTKEIIVFGDIGSVFISASIAIEMLTGMGCGARSPRLYLVLFFNCWFCDNQAGLMFSSLLPTSWAVPVILMTAVSPSPPAGGGSPRDRIPRLLGVGAVNQPCMVKIVDAPLVEGASTTAINLCISSDISDAIQAGEQACGIKKI